MRVEKVLSMFGLILCNLYKLCHFKVGSCFCLNTPPENENKDEIGYTIELKWVIGSGAVC